MPPRDVGNGGSHVRRPSTCATARPPFARWKPRPSTWWVIGGGITGAGVARDAALRGLSVALIEARDFASGTSSRSSKMIHGGLRYLAQGDTALVKEAASERQVMRRIAPHLTRISPFIVPAPNLASVAKLRAGPVAVRKAWRGAGQRTPPDVEPGRAGRTGAAPG